MGKTVDAEIIQMAREFGREFEGNSSTNGFSYCQMIEIMAFDEVLKNLKRHLIVCRMYENRILKAQRRGKPVSNDTPPRKLFDWQNRYISIIRDDERFLELEARQIGYARIATKQQAEYEQTGKFPAIDKLTLGLWEQRQKDQKEAEQKTNPGVCCKAVNFCKNLVKH